MKMIDFSFKITVFIPKLHIERDKKMAKLDYYSFNRYICVLHKKNAYLPRSNCVSSGFNSKRTRGKMAQSQGKQLQHDNNISCSCLFVCLLPIYRARYIPFYHIFRYITLCKTHVCLYAFTELDMHVDSKCKIAILATITEAALPQTIMFWHFYPISSNTNICVTTTLLKIRYYNTCNK
jgi:hypothetical protein